MGRERENRIIGRIMSLAMREDDGCKKTEEYFEHLYNVDMEEP